MTTETLSAHQIRESFLRGELTARANTERTFAMIDAHAGLGAFLSTARVDALARADALDAKKARGGTFGVLAGVPIAIKDAIATSFGTTTSGSKILCKSVAEPSSERDGYHAPFDATVIERLLAADAILVGKTNMDEFAMGSSNENSAFFSAKNPHDETRVPGGSSGGSAVAVAAGLVPLALGSDTGGSIRQPAAMCGVVGVKPTYGRVSRFGLFAFASSLDQIGVFARSTEDAALASNVIAGFDPRDATSRNVPSRDWSPRADPSLAGLRIGIPREYFGEGIDAAVAAKVRESIEDLRGLGAEIVDVEMPHTRYAVATYYVIATAEASSNLSRYDGVRFGSRAEVPGQSLRELYARTRGRGFGREVKRRIMLGTFVLSAGYYDAYYKKALDVRRLITRDFDEVFQHVDVLAAPTSPTVAFPLGARTRDPLAMYLADICTLPASLAGVPALSVPCGTALPSDGGINPLPVGLQLMGRSFEENRLFDVAHALERAAASTRTA